MNFEICPVCSGKGLVPCDFYDIGGVKNTQQSILPLTCRSCQEKGYIKVSDPDPYQPYLPYWPYLEPTYPTYPYPTKYPKDDSQ